MKNYLETWETEPTPGAAPALPAAVDQDRRCLPILDAQGNHIPDKRPRCGFAAHLYDHEGKMR